MNNITIGILVLMALLIGIGIWFYFQGDRMMSEAGPAGQHGHADEVAAFEISPGDALKRIESSADVVLLDVRTPEEYAEVHIQDALLLPVQEISQDTLSEIGLGSTAKDTEIILYCRSGARSQTAYNILNSLGYTNVKSVAGGMVHWEEDGYPHTESGEYTGPMHGLESNESSGEVTDGPRVSFDRTQHDFGTVPQYGGTVETDFTLTNTGAETLEVGTITTSCSCTSAAISDSSVAPGDSATVTVVFDPDFHEEPGGTFTRTAFIPTNDPNTPEAEVSIRVDIAEGQ